MKGKVGEDGRYRKRQYNPGDVASLLIPTGMAINAGIGLLNPLGGSGGYTKLPYLALRILVKHPM